MRFLLGLVIGALLGAGVLVLYLVFEGSPVGGPTDPLPTDPPVTVALGTKLLEQVVQRGVREVPGLGVDPQAVKVATRKGELVVTAPFEVMGKQTRGSIVLRPSVQRGQLKLDVAGTGVGGLPLPKATPSIEKAIDSHVRALMKQMPVTITGATVDPKLGLVVTGDVDLGRLEAALRQM